MTSPFCNLLFIRNDIHSRNTLIHANRIKRLNDIERASGNYILYWMQSAQRADFNHALEYAVRQSNSLRQPLGVVFCLVNRYPKANRSHYRFMLEGLVDVRDALEKRAIPFQVIKDSMERVIPSFAEEASLIVVDRDYQREQRDWRASVASAIECPIFQVETNVIVPVETASPKEEYTAGTLRPKIQRKLEDYLVPLRNQHVKIHSEGIGTNTIDLDDIDSILKGISVENDIKQTLLFRGGTNEVERRLSRFISQDLDVFGNLRNDPARDRLSNMSPYLHFGQISPLWIALEIKKVRSPGSEAFLEELIIRRELSMNFVYYNENYDNFECLPGWAKETLELHSFDKREYTYSYKELEQAKTHDPYWNAAQREMTTKGKMHGYMRMYWGKKILEWSESPYEAYDTCTRLNDTYELDGRDPNGYAGVAWCFGKHDRAWSERPIFGKVRFMNENGLRRKFNIEEYVNRINQL